MLSVVDYEPGQLAAVRSMDHVRWFISLLTWPVAKSRLSPELGIGDVFGCPGTGEELAVITVSRCHLIPVFRSPGELADLKHLQAELLDLCGYA